MFLLMFTIHVSRARNVYTRLVSKLSASVQFNFKFPNYLNALYNFERLKLFNPRNSLRVVKKKRNNLCLVPFTYNRLNWSIISINFFSTVSRLRLETPLSPIASNESIFNQRADLSTSAQKRNRDRGKKSHQNIRHKLSRWITQRKPSREEIEEKA